MAKKEINPNADKDHIDQLDLTNEHVFPKFLKSIRLAPFRHITDLTINFVHPISIIAGTVCRQSNLNFSLRSVLVNSKLIYFSDISI